MQRQQFAQLTELYKHWNARINVISRKDIDQLEIHHLLHSLSIAKIISFAPGTSIIDIGTGGGLPGIPLAILFPQVKFTLVDSIGKKITVVEAIAKELNLQNIVAVKSRAEELKMKADFVVTRAVAPLLEIYHWTKNLISARTENTLKSGWLFLKGGDLADEIYNSGLEVEQFDISSFFEEDFFLAKKVIYLPLRRD